MPIVAGSFVTTGSAYMPDFGVIVYEPGGSGIVTPAFVNVVTVIGAPVHWLYVKSSEPSGPVTVKTAGPLNGVPSAFCGWKVSVTGLYT